jgi:hypothetical protein
MTRFDECSTLAHTRLFVGPPRSTSRNRSTFHRSKSSAPIDIWHFKGHSRAGRRGRDRSPDGRRRARHRGANDSRIDYTEADRAAAPSTADRGRAPLVSDLHKFGRSAPTTLAPWVPMASLGSIA